MVIPSQSSSARLRWRAVVISRHNAGLRLCVLRRRQTSCCETAGGRAVSAEQAAGDRGQAAAGGTRTRGQERRHGMPSWHNILVDRCRMPKCFLNSSKLGGETCGQSNVLKGSVSARALDRCSTCVIKISHIELYEDENESGRMDSGGSLFFYPGAKFASTIHTTKGTQTPQNATAGRGGFRGFQRPNSETAHLTDILTHAWQPRVF